MDFFKFNLLPFFFFRGGGLFAVGLFLICVFCYIRFCTHSLNISIFMYVFDLSQFLFCSVLIIEFYKQLLLVLVNKNMAVDSRLEPDNPATPK